MRYDLYFLLSRRQQRKLSKMIPIVMLEFLPMDDFKKVTTNKKLIEMFINLKRSTIKRVA